MFSIHGANQIKLFSKLLDSLSQFNLVNVNLNANFIQIEQIESGRNFMGLLRINSTFFYDWRIESRLQFSLPIKSLLRVLRISHGAAFVKFIFDACEMQVCILKDYTTLDYSILLKPYETENLIGGNKLCEPIKFNGLLFFGALKKLTNITPIVSLCINSSKLLIKAQENGISACTCINKVEHEEHEISTVQFKLSHLPIQNLYDIAQEEDIVCEIRGCEPLDFFINNNMFMLNFLIAPLLNN